MTSSDGRYNDSMLHGVISAVRSRAAQTAARCRELDAARRASEAKLSEALADARLTETCDERCYAEICDAHAERNRHDPQLRAAYKMHTLFAFGGLLVCSLALTFPPAAAAAATAGGAIWLIRRTRQRHAQ